MKAYLTDYNNNLLWQEQTEFNAGMDAMRTVRIYRDRRYQTIQGFGGAFTEAAGWSLSCLSKEDREAVIDGYFGKDGLRYNMGRTHIGSCDFALGNYAYLKDENDPISNFDISRDEKYIIPMIKAALEKNGEICLMATPWSAPAFMKTNGDMNHGGQVKQECRQAWADYIVQFIREYEKRGIKVSKLSVQNEPAAVQTWDSCIYSGEEEGAMVAEILGPTLEKAGLGHIGIYIWDHNKEVMYDRAHETLSVPGAAKYVKGVAFHWYTGDHFDAVSLTHEAFPDLDFVFTEGCVEYSRFADSNEVGKAEMYAHDMLGNLKAGATGIIDWNLLLGSKGGPNHVGNFCAAPMMCTDDFKGFEKRLSYYYIGQFSRYIERGAVRLATSTFTDKIESVAFENPDGSIVTVLLNRSEEHIPFTLTDGKTGSWIGVPAHSIMTVIQ